MRFWFSPLYSACECCRCCGIGRSCPAAPAGQDARWQQHAQNVRIVRDNWGIAHIYGKSDADAVFGMIYAQAEDDFGRIERNYLNGLGMLAQAEGESGDLQRPAAATVHRSAPAAAKLSQAVRRGSRR